MRDKSVSRTLLEQLCKDIPGGADAVVNEAIEAEILTEELRKRLTRWEFRWALQDANAEGAHRATVLYQWLARKLTRPEMEKVHHTINTALTRYQHDLLARKKAPR